MRSVQHQVADQVRAVTTPLAEQAASAFAQATGVTVKPRQVTHRPAESHASEATTSHASENGHDGSARASHTPAASRNGSAGLRKTRTARATTARPGGRARERPGGNRRCQARQAGLAAFEHQQEGQARQQVRRGGHEGRG